MSEPTPRKLTPEELSEIDARAKAATPGPWNVIESQLESDYTNEDFWFVRFSFCAQPFESKDSTLMDKSDATFIAHAREDVPRLLAHAAALEAEIARLRGKLIEAAEDLERKAEWANTPSCCPTLEALAEGITIQATDLRAEAQR